MSEFDTTSTESLVCPYCGTEQEDAREQEDWGIPEEWTCCDCCKDFVYTTETYVKFTSEDLGEYLSDKIEQEKYHLLVLEKESKSETAIERSKKRLEDLEKRFDLFAKSCFEDVKND